MASTSDCLNLIKNSSYGENNWKWKRKTKYKIGEFAVREFINPDSTVLLIIVETINGDLSIHQTITGLDNVSGFNGKLSLELPKSEYSKIPDSVLSKLSGNNLNHLSAAMIKAIEDSCDLDEAIDELNTNNNWNYITQEYLSSKEKKARSSDYQQFMKNYIDDLGLFFALENVYAEVKTINGIPDFSYLAVNAGGDWECHINLFIYNTSEDPNQIKIYLPLDKGNIYIKDLMCAVGSVDEFSNATSKHEDEEAELMEKYNERDFVKKLDEAALNSFTQHLIKTYK